MPRKQSEVSMPKVLITRDQYLQDIKIRWQIHQYEINKLAEDLNKVAQTVAPYVQKIMDYSVARYQEIRARYVTVR
jgi:translation initiation factor IF-3